MELLSKKKKDINSGEKIALEKFNTWTASMHQGLRQYYSAKTNYFILSQLGMSTDTMSWALQRELDLSEDCDGV